MNFLSSGQDWNITPAVKRIQGAWNSVLQRELCKTSHFWLVHNSQIRLLTSSRDKAPVRNFVCRNKLLHSSSRYNYDSLLCERLCKLTESHRALEVLEVWQGKRQSTALGKERKISRHELPRALMQPHCQAHPQITPCCCSPPGIGNVINGAREEPINNSWGTDWFHGKYNSNLASVTKVFHCPS